MMYGQFAKLLERNNVKTSQVAKDTGISNGTFSDWKNGRTQPKADKLKILADYFGVPVSFFYGEESTDSDRYYLNEETSQIAQDIFENKELRLLFDAARDAEPEDLETVHSMLLALKRKERGE